MKGKRREKKKKLQNNRHTWKSCITEDQIDCEKCALNKRFLKTLNLSDIPVRLCADLWGVQGGGLTLEE